MGYTIETGPYVETTYYNFTALNALKITCRSGKGYLRRHITRQKVQSHVPLIRTYFFVRRLSGVQYIPWRQKSYLYDLPWYYLVLTLADANHLAPVYADSLVVDEESPGDPAGALTTLL